MADVESDAPEAVDEPQTKGKDSAKANAQLNKLRDVLDIVENSKASKSTVDEALKALKKEADEAAEKKKQSEKDLSKIQVKPEDVALLIKELEIPKDDAERRLRLANGAIEKALEDYLKC